MELTQEEEGYDIDALKILKYQRIIDELERRNGDKKE